MPEQSQSEEKEQAAPEMIPGGSEKRAVQPEGQSHAAMAQASGLAAEWKSLSRAERYAKITAIATCCIFAVLLIASLLIVPRTVHVLSQAETELDKIDQIMDSAQETLQQTTQIAEGVSKIDFDKLSESISSLSDAVKVLTGFLN